MRRQFLCLTYTEQDGVLWASATKDACTGPAEAPSGDKKSAMQQLHHTYYPTASSSGIDYLRDSAAAPSDEEYFNITSSGPCLQALTGASVKLSASWLCLVSSSALLLVSSWLVL